MKYLVNEFDLLVYDFDGVMTNNKFTLNPDGGESVILSRADGLAISQFKKFGIKQIILSTEKNPIVKLRSKKLNIDCYNSIGNKKIFLKKYIIKNNIKKKICYIGNDINDIQAAKLCDLIICPLDSYEEFKKISHIVVNKKGGDGVLREVLSLFS